MNRNIREAVEHFQDPKITYIDINPAFDGHRFCEPNSTHRDQFNWNDNVWLWNQPARWWIQINKGDQEDFYDMLGDEPKMPPWDEYDKLLAHPEGETLYDGQTFSRKYVDPDDPSHTMLVGGTLDDFRVTGGSGDGIMGRTLHPKQSGHEEMAKILIEVLARRFKSGATPQPWGPDNCPTGCTCSSIGIPPLCP